MKGTRLNIRLEPRHVVGIAIAKDKKKALGYTFPSISSIIREALEVYFASKNITDEMIADKLSEESKG